MRRAPLLLLAMLLAAPARADIVLSGSQHIGDGEAAAYVPRDPVTRSQMQANPTHFFLSQSATVTAVQLTNEVDLDDRLQVFIDDMANALAGTRSGSCSDGGTCTYTLDTPIVLGAGDHTIWPDGGCTSGTTYATPCGGGAGENDFSFDSIVLVSSQTTTAGGDHRRRHLGETADSDNDYGGRWYPDAADGSSVSVPFTADITRLVSEVRFWNLRDVSATALTHATVAIDGVPVGTLTADGNPARLYPGTLAVAGMHTLTVTVGQGTLTDADDISWDDIEIILVNNPATTPGAFNVVDAGADAATGRLSTRTAGLATTVDLVALSGGSQLTTYTGAHNTIELLDASNTTGVTTGGSNCDAGWVSVATLGTDVPFTAAEGGRHAFAFTYADALSSARIKVTDTDLAVTGCSSDAFAIKPDHYDVTVTHGDWTSAGTAESLAGSGFTATSLPIHKAGQPFTLVAIAKNAAGATTASYVPTSVTYDQASSVATLGSIAGSGSLGTLAWSNGVGTTTTATYKEVGAVRFALADTTFADVDAADTAPASRTVGPSSIEIGRFVPDHFKLTETTAAQFAPACTANGGFTYVGQPFAFATTPGVTLTAVAADGTVTANYDGALYKLTVASQSTYSVTNGALVTASPDNSSVNSGGGVTTYTIIPPAGGFSFTRAPAPVVPFSADIRITPVIAEGDDVTGVLGHVGESGLDGVIPFVIGGVESANARRMRYGRLVIDNAHGSERLPLKVPMRAEYFETVAGSTGFVRNLLDSCTSVAGQVEVTPGVPGSTSLSGLGTLSQGQLVPELSAPDFTEQVLLEAQISGSMPWLLTGASYAAHPTATATFGLFRNEERRIYQREVFN